MGNTQIQVDRDGNNLSRWQTSNVVFEVYSTDRLSNQRLDQRTERRSRTLLVIAMAWGICFVNLCCHSTFPDLQKLIIPRSDKGNIRRHSVLPKSRETSREGKLNFKYHLFQPQFPKVSQSTADQNSALLPRCAVAFPWTAPSHIDHSLLAPALRPASPDFQPLCIIITAPPGLSQPCLPLLTAPTPNSQAWNSLDHCIMKVLFGLQVIHLLRPPAGWCLINCILH